MSRTTTKTITKTPSRHSKRSKSKDEDLRFDAKDPILDSSSESEWNSEDTDTEDEEAEIWMRLRISAGKIDIPPEYWQLHKLVKYLKGSTPPTTAAVLACILDYDLESEFMQLALFESKVLEPMVNLLEHAGRDFRCKKLSLLILSRTTRHPLVQQEVTNMGAIPLLVDGLTDPARDLQKLAAAVIANVAKLKKSSRLVRLCGGIPYLVNMLEIDDKLLNRPSSKLSEDEIEHLDVVSAAARALWSLSLLDGNKVEMEKAGILGFVPKLLKAPHKDVVMSTMGILQNCGDQPEFQKAIVTLDLVKDFVKLFSSDSDELQMLCALAMFKHSDEEKIRDLVRKHNGLAPLVRVLQQETIRGNVELLTAVTGAVWKLAISEENIRQFDRVNTIPTLVKLLDADDETVLVNVTGALAECAKLSHNGIVIKRAGGIPPLVDLLNRTNEYLLANTAHALGECAWDLDCMAEMEEQDAVRLIWSLLKNPSTKVQANAAWALVPCIQNASESGEMVRSFVGGVELIVKRLKSPDNRVVACTCAALAMLATDQENLGVVTDLGVVPILAKLCKNTEDDEFLQEHLASAIANCCTLMKNCFEFGRLGAVSPLMDFLYNSNERVQVATIDALSHLSLDSFNCIALHQSGVVPMLIKAAGSADLRKQRAAAKCLSNIRKLALRADKHRVAEKMRNENEKSEKRHQRETLDDIGQRVLSREILLSIDLRQSRDLQRESSGREKQLSFKLK